MKRILFLALMLGLCGARAQAQNTVVTATVIDPHGHPYQAGYGQDSIQCPGNAQPYLNGSPLTRSIPIPALDGNGKFTVSLWDTTGLTDANNAPLACQWRVQITDHCQIATFSALLTGVTGPGPVDVSSQVNAVSVPLSAPCTPSGGSGGSVVSFGAGNLSPLFTTTVTNPATTPFLSFLLNTAPANTVFANLTGSTALPAFDATQGTDTKVLTAGTVSGTGAALCTDANGGATTSACPTGGSVTSVGGTAPIVATPNPITNSGSVSCPTCVTTVTGTSPIVSSGGTTPALSCPTCTTVTNPVKRLILPFASCISGAPAPAWDTPASSSAVAACKTGGVNGTVQGVLQFADAQLAYYSGVVPQDWQSWGLSRLSFTTSDTTVGHTIIFQLLLACEAPNSGLVDDPAYGSANAYATVTIGGGAVANASYQVSTGSLTGGGCAAGSLIHFKLLRATDTSTDSAVTATGWLEVLYNGTFN